MDVTMVATTDDTNGEQDDTNYDALPVMFGDEIAHAIPTDVVETVARYHNVHTPRLHGVLNAIDAALPDAHGSRMDNLELYMDQQDTHVGLTQDEALILNDTAFQTLAGEAGFDRSERLFIAARDAHDTYATDVTGDSWHAATAVVLRRTTEAVDVPSCECGADLVETAELTEARGTTADLRDPTTVPVPEAECGECEASVGALYGMEVVVELFEARGVDLPGDDE
ncbi:hypothetical protein C478_07347 [Natrinema thermotolerans DSM 11552]|nr:hypothetical protein C478_07347 [Natrinema thermotolerans DSM 11552]